MTNTIKKNKRKNEFGMLPAKLRTPVRRLLRLKGSRRTHAVDDIREELMEIINYYEAQYD